MKIAKSLVFLLLFAASVIIISLNSPAEINSYEKGSSIKEGARLLQAGKPMEALVQLETFDNNKAKLLKAYCL
ncbi:MAG: hypothetical protein NT030_02975, partial [Candidatus Saganbacteria bacterium]|nr:hypothetical protein [Candidatus Saganbacteria bacterium]